MMDLDQRIAELMERGSWTFPYPHLSPSQCWSWTNCPACYEAQYVLKLPRPTSVDLCIGQFAHKAVAWARDQMLTANPPPDYVGYQAGALEAGNDAFNRTIAEQVEVDDAGVMIPIEIDLTNKYKDVGEAKDRAVAVVKTALPELLKYDLKAGVVAHEARVKHLGVPNPQDARSEADQLDLEAEAKEQAEAGITPVFPFPVKAYLDVMYANEVKKDLKTSSRKGPPDYVASLQLMMYDLPWFEAGQPQRLGFDVVTKTVSPSYGCYWLNGDGIVTPEQYKYAKYRVLRIAEQISLGNFDPRESFFCSYSHGLPKGELAETALAEVG
jgi:hypothetical protein